MKIDDFVNCLEKELEVRYDACEDFVATPSSILLTVLNAVAGAKFTASQQAVKADANIDAVCNCIATNVLHEKTFPLATKKRTA